MEEIKIYHNSQELNYRNPFGAIELGKTVKISLFSNRDVNVVIYVIGFDGEKHSLLMKKESINNNEFMFTCEIETLNHLGLINYYFKITGTDIELYYGNNNEELGGEGKIYLSNPKLYQITVYKKREVPHWYKNGIIYQIFVDRFFNGNEKGIVNNPKENSFIYGRWDDDPMYIKDINGNILRWDFYGGNLAGVKKKLNYIKALGANIIYMNPIFESPSCHKYDTSDYEKIDCMFGTEENFIELCSEADKLGIKIILDGVFSHTGDSSKYFNKYGKYESIGAYQSKESPYYEWYRFYEYPDKYECWWGIDNMPNIDELNKNYVDYIIKGENSIIKKWLQLGASGWRLDVADELPDEFIKMIKKKMLDIKKSSVLIGEVWEDASNKVSYSKRREYLFGDELDSVTNYPLRNLILQFLKGHTDSYMVNKRIMNIYENYPIENFYSNMNLLGNHDTERILTVLGENFYLLKLSIIIQMTLPGVPLIYYGDEAGLKGNKDPDNRKTYPWNNPNIELIDFYKKIISVRNSEELLRSGTFKPMYIVNDILAFKRENNESSIIVLINRSNYKSTLQLEVGSTNFKNVEETDDYYRPINGTLNITLESYGYKIIKSI